MSDRSSNSIASPVRARGAGRRLKNAWRALNGTDGAPSALQAPAIELPLEGHGSNEDGSRLSIPFLENLSDDDLQQLNACLPWTCFVADSQGRRFGNAASLTKRQKPQTVPAARIVQMDEYFDLSDKHVVEFGCYEGIHTIALLQRAARVTAIDSRIENVVKTIVRCAAFDLAPRVRVIDVDSNFESEDLQADLGHHTGVLYHLADPVGHLLALGRHLRCGLLLDTHYALPELATETYESQGRQWNYQRYQEGGRADVFSGMSDHSKWLTLETLTQVLNEAGFDHVEVLETRAERNGARLLLVARRTSA